MVTIGFYIYTICLYIYIRLGFLWTLLVIWCFDDIIGAKVFVNRDYDALTARAVTAAKGSVKESQEPAVGRAKVKLLGHKYLG